MQTKKQSGIEALTNTASAFIISATAHKFYVSEKIVEYTADGGDPTGWQCALAITMFYTALSLARNYTWRRIFNR